MCTKFQVCIVFSLAKKSRTARPKDILTCECFCLSVSLYGTSWPNEKRYRPEIWYTHSPRPYLKTGFLFFQKRYLRTSSLEKLQSRGFSAYLLDCLVSSVLLNFLVFFYKKSKTTPVVISNKYLRGIF